MHICLPTIAHLNTSRLRLQTQRYAESIQLVKFEPKTSLIVNPAVEESLVEKEALVPAAPGPKDTSSVSERLAVWRKIERHEPVLLNSAIVTP